MTHDPPASMPAGAHPDDDPPAELIASSKRKFALAQARMRRNQHELALLSLAGSLHDALCHHLLLRNNPAVREGTDILLDALYIDPDLPLSQGEVERARRIYSLQARVAQGDAVTVTRESVDAYYAFVARLLSRYGVTVVAPDVDPADPDPDPDRFPESDGPFPKREKNALAKHLDALWQHHHERLVPIMTLVLLFLVGATIVIIMQQSRLAESGAPVPTPTPTLFVPALNLATSTPTLTPTPVRPTPAGTPTPRAPESPGSLVAGGSATVRLDVATGLALRAEPGTAATIPVIIYLEPGAVVELLEGPVSGADGYNWWRVRSGEYEGWCAGEFLDGG